MLKAYFASALTRLEAIQRENVRLLSTRVSSVCHKSGYELYIPGNWTDPRDNPGLDDGAVYLRDREQVTSSDLIILYTEYPSFGAGQELEIATTAGIPALLLIKEGTLISRMINGCLAQVYRVNFDDRNLEQELGEKLQALKPHLFALRQGKHDEDKGYCKRVMDGMEKHTFEAEELAELVGTSAKMIQLIVDGKIHVANPSYLLTEYIFREISRPVTPYDLAEPRQKLLDLVPLNRKRIAARASQSEVSQPPSAVRKEPISTRPPFLGVTLAWLRDYTHLAIKRVTLKVLKEVIREAQKRGALLTENQCRDFVNFLAGAPEIRDTSVRLDSDLLKLVLGKFLQSTGGSLPHG